MQKKNVTLDRRSFEDELKVFSSQKTFFMDWLLRVLIWFQENKWDEKSKRTISTIFYK